MPSRCRLGVVADVLPSGSHEACWVLQAVPGEQSLNRISAFRKTDRLNMLLAGEAVLTIPVLGHIRRLVLLMHAQR